MREFWYASDETRLFGVEQGQGAPLLLFHGGGATHHACLGLTARLAGQHRVVTPDLRGSGRSWDGRPLSWDRLADDVVALLDHLDIERAAVGGPSMGAATGLRCALRHPDRVAVLIMVTPAYGGAELGLSTFQTEAFARMNALAGRALGEGLEALREMYRASPAMEAYFDRVSGTLDVASFAATSALMASGAQPFSANAELDRIPVPTLLVPGDDPMHPAAVSALFAERIPGCVTRERPALFDPAELDAATAKIIADFLRDQPA